MELYVLVNKYFNKGGQQLENWIAEIVGKMHLYKITQSDLAEELGIRRDYLNKILNGKERPANAEKNITNALNKVIENKKS